MKGVYTFEELMNYSPRTERGSHSIDCEYQLKSVECDGIDCTCKPKLVQIGWKSDGQTAGGSK